MAPRSSPPLPSHRSSTYQQQQTLAPIAQNGGLDRSPRSPYRSHPYLPPILSPNEKDGREDLAGAGIQRLRSYSYSNSNPHSRSTSPRGRAKENKDVLMASGPARERAYTDLNAYTTSSKPISVGENARDSSPDTGTRMKVDGLNLKTSGSIVPLKMPLPPPPSALPPSMQNQNHAQPKEDGIDSDMGRGDGEALGVESGRATLVSVSDIRSQPVEKDAKRGEDAMDIDEEGTRATVSGESASRSLGAGKERDGNTTAPPPPLQVHQHHQQSQPPLSASVTSPTLSTSSSGQPKTPTSSTDFTSFRDRSNSNVRSPRLSTSGLPKGMSLVPLDYLRNAQAPRRDPRDDMLLRQLTATALTTC